MHARRLARTSSTAPAALALSLLGLFSLPASLASADFSPFYSIPIRWCIVKGSPTQMSPGLVGEPDVDSVLWRRHERASEATYIPEAGVTLRSGLEFILRDPNLSFPMIEDPDTSDSDHKPGDVLDPSCDSNPDSEFEKVLADCRTAWDRDYTDQKDIGILAVVIRKFVDPEGMARMCMDTSGRTATGRRGGSWPGYRAVVVEDGAFASPKTAGGINDTPDSDDAVDKTFAHEVGHSLPTPFDLEGNRGLNHVCANPPPGATTNLMTQGRFDNAPADGLADNFHLGTVAEVIHPGDDRMECTPDDRRAEIDQVAAIRAAAKETPGCKIAGTDMNCTTFSDSATDDDEIDLTDPYLNLTYLSVSALSTVPKTQIDLELLNPIPSEAFEGNRTLRYFVLFDLDGNPLTGGRPSLLEGGLSGTDLYLDVEIERRPDLFPMSVQAFRFTGADFVEVVDPGLTVRLLPLELRSDGDEPDIPSVRLGDAIEIDLPNAVRGPFSVPLRAQAISATFGTGTAGLFTIIDRLEAQGEGAGEPLRLEPPHFPLCSVAPAAIPRRGLATVEASGLVPLSPIHVFLGDVRVGGGATDAQGRADVSFQIPGEMPTGNHVVTVGVDGTGLTADCIAAITSRDCNRNGIEDSVDIASGLSQDVNLNGRPDECEVYSYVWRFGGLAQGGLITATIQGRTGTCNVSLTTTAGQTPAMVAAAFAAVLQASPCLAGQAITAVAEGDAVRIRGFLLQPGDITYVSTDAGLLHSTPLVEIPTLSGIGAALLVLILLIAGSLKLSASGSGRSRER